MATCPIQRRFATVVLTLAVTSAFPSLCWSQGSSVAPHDERHSGVTQTQAGQSRAATIQHSVYENSCVDDAFPHPIHDSSCHCSGYHDRKCNVGFDGCVSNGTLFQWSYGPGSHGGPDLDQPLVTDRPDFTEASSTVGKGVAQIEFGYTLNYNAENGTSERSQSWGEPLLRYGIFADWLELRLALFPVEERTTVADTSNTASGTEDLYFGFKIGLTPQAGVLPEMALIPQMSIPSGSAALTDGEVLPGLNWIYSWNINDSISIAGSTQGNRVVDGTSNQPHLEIAQSVAVAYTLTDELGAYAEWFALLPHSADTETPEYYFNGGFTLLLNEDVQFDVRSGLGLNNAAADYFFGTGLSIRYK